MRSAVTGMCMAAMLLVAAGCEPEAAYQLSLPETGWSIESVDGVALSGDTSLVFADADRAMLSSSCGETELGWAWDSDGSAMSFAVPDPEGACRDDDGVRTILDALIGVESWTVESRDKIILKGSHELNLERLSQ